jgi:hypothetical protein
VFAALVQLARLRKDHPVFGVSGLTVLEAPHRSVLAFDKMLGAERLTMVGSFSEEPISLDAVAMARLLGEKSGRDLVTGRPVLASESLELEPCGRRLVLTSAPSECSRTSKPTASLA